jgi:pimeloyl-ACP methyl ester carboxylesterase
VSREPTRARYPDTTGHAERDGVRIFYEVYGEGEPAVVLVQGWATPARGWKGQIPFLARDFRVVAYDQRGLGHSTRPQGATAYHYTEHAADLLCVMDAAGIASAVLIGVSGGAQTILAMAADHPERVRAIQLIGPFAPTTENDPTPERRRELESMRSQIVADFDTFAELTLDERIFTDPHMTREREDALEWWRDAGPEVWVDSYLGYALDAPTARELCERIDCPVHVIHGENDEAAPLEWGRELAERTGGELLMVPDSGHIPAGGWIVRLNLEIRRFVESIA